MSDCASVALWPVCTQECGLFMDDVRVPALTQQLYDEEHVLADFSSHFGLAACRADIVASEPDTPQVIWTDGAAPQNQDSRFRRAGSGIFYGLSHALNWSGILPGLAQSNQRAELFAVVVACLRDPRKLEIRTDSDWVCKGFQSWREWAVAGWQGEHADLWDALACELLSRASDVTVSWVKGHAKQIDVNRGRTTQEDKLGNDEADLLAVAGAAMHCAPADIVAAAKERRDLAKRTHAMMVAIVIERQRQENQHVSASNADRGSDMGEDDICYLNDEDIDLEGAILSAGC